MGWALEEGRTAREEGGNSWSGSRESLGHCESRRDVVLVPKSDKRWGRAGEEVRGREGAAGTAGTRAIRGGRANRALVVKQALIRRSDGGPAIRSTEALVAGRKTEGRDNRAVGEAGKRSVERECRRLIPLRGRSAAHGEEVCVPLGKSPSEGDAGTARLG